VTADQISLRDEAYYKEHMIEFVLNREVVLRINGFYFLAAVHDQHLLWFYFYDDCARCGS